jgi:hypothetical protein
MPINATKNLTDQQPFRFAVDSALLGELGEKLVSTVHVALSELVKMRMTRMLRMSPLAFSLKNQKPHDYCRR